MNLKYINQSLVKSSEKETFCPKKYLETEILGNFKREPSLAMIQGQYFEYLATGALNREGEVAEIPFTQKAKKTTAQVRIEWQAQKFTENLAKNDIQIVSVGGLLKFHLYKEFLTTGIEDTEVLYKGLPYILDIKLTGDINNDYGDFCWGAFGKMDKLQAYTYVLLKYHMTGIRYGFLYYVADHKKKPESVLLEVENPLENHMEVYRRFRQTYFRMVRFEKQGYPEVPSKDCKSCPVTSCKFNGKEHQFKKSIINESEVLDELKKIEQANKIAAMREKFSSYQKQKAKLFKNDYDVIY